MLSMSLYSVRGSRAVPSWTFLCRRGVYKLRGDIYMMSAPAGGRGAVNEKADNVREIVHIDLHNAEKGEGVPEYKTFAGVI